MSSDDEGIRVETRERVWDQLRSVARPDSRFAWDFGEFIADYEGSSDGAARILELADRLDCETWLVTPDNNLSPLRERLIKRDYTFLMPTYGIRRGFLKLDSQTVPAGDEQFAATLDGMTRFGTTVPLERLETTHSSLDIMVTGASFVTPSGLRMGKGHGFFDQKWAMLREVGLATSETTLVAAVHDVQVLEEEAVGEALVEPHDTIVDYIVTPTRTIRTDADRSRPEGIHWDLLTMAEVETIPPLKTLWRHAGEPQLEE